MSIIWLAVFSFSADLSNRSLYRLSQSNKFLLILWIFFANSGGNGIPFSFAQVKKSTGMTGSYNLLHLTALRANSFVLLNSSINGDVYAAVVIKPVPEIILGFPQMIVRLLRLGSSRSSLPSIRNPLVHQVHLKILSGLPRGTG